MANQFVVQLKNEPGAMATLAEALAARGVDLRAIGGGSIGDSGHVIMTTADDATTKANREGIAHFRLRPRRLADVSAGDLRTEIFGTTWPAPCRKVRVALEIDASITSAADVISADLIIIGLQSGCRSFNSAASPAT